MWQYASGAELPIAGWWLYDGQSLATGLDAGHTFELKVFPAGGASVLTKTTGIVGQAGTGTGRGSSDTPNVVFTWAAGELALPAGRYRVQLRVVRTVDGFDWIEHDDLVITPGPTAVAPVSGDAFAELIETWPLAGSYDSDDEIPAIIDGVPSRLLVATFTGPAGADGANGINGVDGTDGVDAPTVAWEEASVATDESTTSATYVDLTTPGPAVTHTVTASGTVKVTLSSVLYNTTSSRATFASFAMSGANTQVASDSLMLYYTTISGSAQMEASKVMIVSGLTPGATTFTMKYRSTAGGTGHFARRSILVEDM
jgi:hypothetical protein